MKTILLIFLVFCSGCVSYKLQNSTSQKYTFQFEILGSSSKMSQQKLSAMLDKNLAEYKIYDSINAKNTCLLYTVSLNENNSLIISRSIYSCRYFIQNMLKSGSYFKLYLLQNNSDKTLIYEYADKVNLNLFKKIQIPFNRKFIYAIN